MKEELSIPYLRVDLKIGQTIRRMREAKGLQVRQVAAQMDILGCNITENRLTKIEANKYNLRISELVALRSIFKCEYNDFFIGLDIEMLETRNQKVLERLEAKE